MRGLQRHGLATLDGLEHVVEVLLGLVDPPRDVAAGREVGPLRQLGLEVGKNPIVALEKRLLNTIRNLV